jgi:hypothetical protein
MIGAPEPQVRQRPVVKNARMAMAKGKQLG